MREIKLIDTGNLIAVIYRRDHFHHWAVKEINQMPAPLLTCEAVLAEACFLAQRMPVNKPCRL